MTDTPAFGAPAIPPATNYALRQVGGLQTLAYMENTTEPFIKRDFIAAYKLAPLAVQMDTELRAALPEQVIKQLSDGKSMDAPKKIAEPIDFVEVTRIVEDKRRRDEEEQERRMAEGRQRHSQQVAWLKEKGQL